MLEGLSWVKPQRWVEPIGFIPVEVMGMLKFLIDLEFEKSSQFQRLRRLSLISKLMPAG
jgi:hypothetical protein